MSGIVASTLHAPLPVHVLDISNTVNPDVAALLSAGGWFGTQQPVRIINSGLVNTLEVPASLAGADITLVNAAGALIGGLRNSGTALKVRSAIKINNLGSIRGGGGAGGGGASTNVQFQAPTYVPAVGWGYGGVGGNGQGFFPGGLTVYPASAGDAGTSSGVIYGEDPGGGTFGGGKPWAQAYGGNGGWGGPWGTSGYPGDAASYSSSSGSGSTGQGTAGVPAGYYIDGNNFATWINAGERLGRFLP